MENLFYDHVSHFIFLFGTTLHSYLGILESTINLSLLALLQGTYLVVMDGYRNLTGSYSISLFCQASEPETQCPNHDLALSRMAFLFGFTSMDPFDVTCQMAAQYGLCSGNLAR